MKQKTIISANEAKSILLRGEVLENYIVEEDLDLYNHGRIECNIQIKGCLIYSLESTGGWFEGKVELEDTAIKKCNFNSAFFVGGLIINQCAFDSYLDFQCGGHNSKEHPFIISNSIFEDFVNFFDCHYHGKVIITNNNFKKGTNLKGHLGQNIEVRFDQPPVIEKNIGQINLDGEGGLKTNVVYLKWPPENDN